MEAFGVNKRDAMNQIRQFGSKFDRLRNAAGGGGGGRNAPKRPKAAPNPASRKSNVFNEQVRYAWHGALQDLKSTPLATFLTVMVIAISLTLPSVCYMVYKNVSSAASQYYPSPQITVYLEKTLDDDAAARVVGQLQAEQGVDKVNYLSRDEALGEFRNWSGFGGALDMLEENPLPAIDAASVQEVQPYCSMWDAIYDCLFFCINQDIYDSLTPEQQAVVDECGKLAVQYEREINRAGDDEILSRWQSKNGVEVVNNDELDIDSFKAIVEPVTEWYIGELQRQGYDDAEELVAAFK
jgi:hypothetical protein